MENTEEDYTTPKQRTDAELFTDLVGKTTEEAEQYLAEHLPTYTMRVTMKEGEPLMGITNIERFRLNVEVENGVVSRIGRLG